MNNGGIPAARLVLAQEWAASAWKNLGLSIPVDVDVVRRHLKLYLRRVDAGYNGGHLLKTPKRWYVVINTRDPMERQRFTAAHEIGEYLLIRHYQRQGKEPPKSSRNERFCDAFAAHLLMPEDIVRQQADELCHGRRNDKRDVLASRFGVSREALNIRLRDLGLHTYLPRA